MRATVRTVYDWIDSVAPFDTQEGFDNSGLLLGRMDIEVSKVLVALDATPAVAREAEEMGAQLILAHHPLMFSARKDIREESYEGALLARLIRSRFSLISAHTNLDQSPYSGSAATARKLGVTDPVADGYLVYGALPSPMTARELATLAKETLGAQTVFFGEGDTRVSVLAVGGGAYDMGFEKARALGAQAFLTGEVRHHNALAAAGEGFPLIEAGHFATENTMIEGLCEGLQKALDALQCRVSVCPSRCPAYAGERVG